jgi:Spy/CpxP family protein refolding chaperone
MQSDVTFSLAQVIWLCGGIMAIVACIGWLMKPINKLNDHEQRIKALEQQEQERKATDRYTTKALNAMIVHMIDGNGVDKLREVRDEYQNEIINRI